MLDLGNPFVQLALMAVIAAYLLFLGLRHNWTAVTTELYQVRGRVAARLRDVRWPQLPTLRAGASAANVGQTRHPTAPYSWQRMLPGMRAPGHGTAMLTPPDDLDEMIRFMHSEHQRLEGRAGAYLVPLGWAVEERGIPHLYWHTLIGDCNHTGTAGQSDTGKDARLMWQTLALMLQHDPSELAVYIIDGKGDWVIFRNCAHVRLLAIDQDEIPQAFAALEAERLRRQQIIRSYTETANVRTKWETLPAELRRSHDMPLMWVVVTEISLLRAAFKNARDFDNALTRELVAARAAGGRWNVSGQFFNGFGTSWRGQISHWASAAQVLDSDDEPNTSLSTKRLVELGAIPPSQLSLPGVFTQVPRGGRRAVTTRDSYLRDTVFASALARLPQRATAPVAVPAPVPSIPVPMHTTASAASPAPPVVAVVATPEPAPVTSVAAVEPPPAAPVYRGPTMTTAEIAAYLQANPHRPQWEIEEELFGEKGGMAYRRVHAAALLLRALAQPPRA